MGEIPDEPVDTFSDQLDRTVSLATDVNGFLDVDFDNSALKRRALTGAGATAVTQGLKFILKFGSAVALGRLLGPAQFGLVAMVSPILGFVSTLNDLGFTQAIVQRRDITAAQVSMLFWINMALSVCLAALVMAAAPLVGLLYHEPRTVNITLVLGALIAVGTLGMIPNALLSRQMRFGSQAGLDIGSQTIGLVATVGPAALGFGYWSLLIGQGATTVLGVAAAYAVVGWLPGRPRRGTGVRPLLHLGANLTGVNLATYFSMTADRMIIGVFGGKVPLGLYDRSYTLVVQPLGQLMAPVGRVALPLLSRLAHDDARYRDAFVNMLRLTMLLTVPAMLVCVAMPTEVVHLALGRKWVAAGPIFGWICSGGLTAPVFGAVGWLFTSQARTREQMLLSVVTAVISIASFAIGMIWGVLGVAIVSAMSFNLLQTPLMVVYVARRGPVGLGDIVRPIAALSVAAAVTAVAVFGIRSLHLPFTLFLAMAASYALFALLVLALPGGRAFYGALWNLRRGVGRGG